MSFSASAAKIVTGRGRALRPAGHGPSGTCDDVGVGDDLAVGRQHDTSANPLALRVAVADVGRHRHHARTKRGRDGSDIEPLIEGFLARLANRQRLVDGWYTPD